MRERGGEMRKGHRQHDSYCSLVLYRATKAFIGLFTFTFSVPCSLLLIPVIPFRLPLSSPPSPPSLSLLPHSFTAPHHSYVLLSPPSPTVPPLPGETKLDRVSSRGAFLTFLIWPLACVPCTLPSFHQNKSPHFRPFITLRRTVPVRSPTPSSPLGSPLRNSPRTFRRCQFTRRLTSRVLGF